MSHTDTPWFVEETDVCAIVDGKQTVIADCLNHQSIDRHNAQDNAERITLCVNACHGISNHALESWLNPPAGQLGAPHGIWTEHLIHQTDAAISAIQKVEKLTGLLIETESFISEIDDPDASHEIKDLLDRIRNSIKDEECPF
jgi:hypothetical protein